MDDEIQTCRRLLSLRIISNIYYINKCITVNKTGNVNLLWVSTSTRGSYNEVNLQQILSVHL